MEIKGEKGITITALVVTIILLLILASISIAAISGQGGLLERAKIAVLNTKTADVKEKVQLKLTNLNLKKMMEDKENATLEDVLEMKNDDDEIIDAYEEDENVVLIIDDYECKVSKNMQVESVSVYSPSKLRKTTRSITYCSFDEENEVE